GAELGEGLGDPALPLVDVDDDPDRTGLGTAHRLRRVPATQRSCAELLVLRRVDAELVGAKPREPAGDLGEHLWSEAAILLGRKPEEPINAVASFDRRQSKKSRASARQTPRPPCRPRQVGRRPRLRAAERR